MSLNLASAGAATTVLSLAKPVLHLLLFAHNSESVSAQTPGVPQGGAACTVEEDCSLGGECSTAGVCVCDPWFTGPSCALLNLQRPQNMSGGTCGKHFDSYHSWGGRVLPVATTTPTPSTTRKSSKKGLSDTVGNKQTPPYEYHLYASFMCHHNSLSEWTTQSSSGHFVGTDGPAGAFTWSEEQCTGDICTPAVIPWSHNTVPIDMAHADPAERWQIWHIGDGIVNSSEWGPCFNSSEVGQTVSTTNTHDGHSAGQPNPKATLERPRAGTFATCSSSSSSSSTSNAETDDDTDPISPANEVFVSYSASPNGPWTRANDNGPLPINYTGAWTATLAGNPAPLELADGTVNLYFTGSPCPAGSGALASNCIAMVQSKNGWRGPFEFVGDAAKAPLTYPESEDPSVFVDPRGNYHMLTNVNTCHRRCAQGIECGGHAWSRDGIHFSNLTIGAFGPYITLANGTGVAHAYVERPLVTLNPDDGKPLAFFVGMGRTAYQDSCTWPQLFCTGAEGELCGPTITPPQGVL